MRIELIFRTEDGDHFEIRDSSSADFEGHIHGATLERGEVFFAYAGRRWLVQSDANNPERFICTPVDEGDQPPA